MKKNWKNVWNVLAHIILAAAIYAYGFLDGLYRGSEAGWDACYRSYLKDHITHLWWMDAPLVWWTVAQGILVLMFAVAVTVVIILRRVQTIEQR